MKCFDATFSSPAENLACDEALLDLCEEQGVEILRFWESRQHFVVVGYANKIESEVNVAECRRRGVPILRRCSGGGTVVQGPGCLNYNLTLGIPESGLLTTVTGTNAFVMERNRAALEQMLGVPVSVKGHTDLVVAASDSPILAHTLNPTLTPKPSTDPEDKRKSASKSMNGITGNEQKNSRVWLKFSGNAQRRRRRALVFHGTILYGFDLGLIDALLRFPSKQPDYRDDRGHAEFVRNIMARTEDVKRALQLAWNAAEPLAQFPEARVRSLVESRYATDTWNRRH